MNLRGNDNQTTALATAEDAQTDPVAACLQGPGHYTLRPQQQREPGAAEVRVRVLGSGVCGSDLALWQGRPWFEYPCAPGAPGHEGWGIVDAVGSDVVDVEPGTTVAGLVRDSFATMSVVARDHIAVVPSSVAQRNDALPLEPLACSVNAEKRAEIQSGDRVVVVGAGFIGITIAALAARRGAHVMALSRRPFALEMAAMHGAERTVCTDAAAEKDPAGAHLRASTDDEVVEHALDWAGGELPDVVVEATGHQTPLDLATKLCRVRGRLLIAGYHQESPRSIDMQTWNWRGIDVINGHERAPEAYMAGIRGALEHLEEGVWDLQRLVTHRFPLERIDDAFRALDERPDDFLKAVVGG